MFLVWPPSAGSSIFPSGHFPFVSASGSLIHLLPSADEVFPLGQDVALGAEDSFVLVPSLEAEAELEISERVLVGLEVVSAELLLVFVSVFDVDTAVLDAEVESPSLVFDTLLVETTDLLVSAAFPDFELVGTPSLGFDALAEESDLVVSLKLVFDVLAEESDLVVSLELVFDALAEESDFVVSLRLLVFDALAEESDLVVSLRLLVFDTLAEESDLAVSLRLLVFDALAEESDLVVSLRLVFDALADEREDLLVSLALPVLDALLVKEDDLVLPVLESVEITLLVFEMPLKEEEGPVSLVLNSVEVFDALLVREADLLVSLALPVLDPVDFPLLVAEFVVAAEDVEADEEEEDLLHVLDVDFASARTRSLSGGLLNFSWMALRVSSATCNRPGSLLERIDKSRNSKIGADTKGDP